MLQQYFDNLPAEIQQERRFIPIKSNKHPAEKGWPESENWCQWNDINPPKQGGRGFVINDSDYLVLDGDSFYTDEGKPCNKEVEELLERLDQLPATYREISMSGYGSHRIFKVPEGLLPEMNGKHMLLGDKENPATGKIPRLELFYRRGRQIVLTGVRVKKTPKTIAQGEKTGAEILDFFNEVKGRLGMDRQEKQEKPAPVAVDERPRGTNGGPSEGERAEAMAASIPPEMLSYAEWVKVGMSLQAAGCSCDVWESWSAKDGARYHEGECAKKWRSFNSAGNGSKALTIAWLHDKAKEYGYSEKDFLRQWYEEHGTNPADDFSDLGEEADELDAPVQGNGWTVKAALLQDRPVFVTLADAGTAEQLNGEGFVSVNLAPGKLPDFINLLKKKHEAGMYPPPVVGLFESGAKVQQEFSSIGLAYLDKWKDRDQLQGEFSGFNAELMEGEAENLQKELLDQERREYINTNSAESFLQEMQEHIATVRPIAKTGFSDLDNKILDGGLYSGLYMVGAMSSAGKTTLTLQIGDNVAAQGVDVMIFSLEMAKTELIAKSISRETFNECNEQRASRDLAKSTREIMTGSKYKTYSNEEKHIIAKAYDRYSQYAKHLYIFEGVGDIGVKRIRRQVERHKHVTGAAPVVIIDYLQILAPYDDKGLTKDNLDKNILELKRMARDMDICIIAISSFNRASYGSENAMAAFNGSANIEYGADVLLKLDYKFNERRKKTVKNKQGETYERFETDAERAPRIAQNRKQMLENDRAGIPATMKLDVLKNRNGGLKPVYLDFTKKYNSYVEKVSDLEEVNDFIIEDEQAGEKQQYDYVL